MNDFAEKKWLLLKTIPNLLNCTCNYASNVVKKVNKCLKKLVPNTRRRPIFFLGLVLLPLVFGSLFINASFKTGRTNFEIFAFSEDSIQEHPAYTTMPEMRFRTQGPISDEEDAKDGIETRAQIKSLEQQILATDVSEMHHTESMSLENSEDNSQLKRVEDYRKTTVNTSNSNLHEPSKETQQETIKSGTNETSYENLDEMEIVRPLDEPYEEEKDLLFYNRIPKCGSTSVLRLLRHLAQKNNFTSITSKDYSTFRMSAEEQELFARNVSSMTHASYNRHMHFLDFTRFGLKQPMYINLVRDPIERFVSLFYYTKQLVKSEVSEGKLGEADLPIWMNMTFDEALDERLSHWNLKINNPEITRFFCGQQSPLCAVAANQKKRIEKAKYNISRYYKVVGIVEEFDKTIEMFEKYLPRFFSGSKTILRKLKGLHENKTFKKKKLETRNHRRLKTRFQEEYELYEFVKKIFHEKAAKLHEL